MTRHAAATRQFPPNARLEPNTEVHALDDSYRTACGMQTIYASRIVRTWDATTCPSCKYELARRVAAVEKQTEAQP